MNVNKILSSINFDSKSLTVDDIRNLKFGDKIKGINKNGTKYYTVLVEGSVPLLRNDEVMLSERMNRDEYLYYKENLK